MRINHVIKTDQWRCALQISPTPHFVVSRMGTQNPPHPAKNSSLTQSVPIGTVHVYWIWITENSLNKSWCLTSCWHGNVIWKQLLTDSFLPLLLEMQNYSKMFIFITVWILCDFSSTAVLGRCLLDSGSDTMAVGLEPKFLLTLSHSCCLINSSSSSCWNSGDGDQTGALHFLVLVDTTATAISCWCSKIQNSLTLW